MFYAFLCIMYYVLCLCLRPVPFSFEGSKQHSHQDYLEKADKARNARLSSSSTK